VVCAKQIVTFILQKNTEVAIQAALILFEINRATGEYSAASRIKLNSLAVPKHWKSAQSGKPGLYPSANSTLGSLSKIAFGLRTDWCSTASQCALSAGRHLNKTAHHLVTECRYTKRVWCLAASWKAQLNLKSEK